jgi:hypothetical protein
MFLVAKKRSMYEYYSRVEYLDRSESRDYQQRKKGPTTPLFIINIVIVDIRWSVLYTFHLITRY